ncbi:MAG TPA: hypothetical protein VLA92_04865 [Candidatus Saccharimonadales bacterium]|nr:hypothetical protein [Candidatus Saccharimonadales bacterium]
MNILRKILVGLCWSLLPVIIFGFGLLISLWLVLGNPDHIKSALKESGVYKSSTAKLFEEVMPASSLTSSSEIPTNNPIVTAALAKAFPPALIESQSNEAINSVYAWMKGDSQRLELSLDFTEAKNNFATYLSAAAYTRVGTLPACPVSGTLVLDLDPFTATCKPFGVTADMAATKVRQEVDQSSLFTNSKLTAADITNGNGQDLNTQLATVPDAYSALRKALIASGVLVVSLSAVVIWLTTPKSKGTKRIGLLFTISGGCTALVALGVGLALDKIVSTFGSGSGEIQQALVHSVNLLIHDVRQWWLLYSVTLLALGIGLLLWVRFTRSEPEATTEQQIPPTLSQPEL